MFNSDGKGATNTAFFLLGNRARISTPPHKAPFNLSLKILTFITLRQHFPITNLMKHLYSHSSLYSTHYKMLVLGIQKIDMGIFVSIVGYLVTENGRTENLLLHHNKLCHWPWLQKLPCISAICSFKSLTYSAH